MEEWDCGCGRTNPGKAGNCLLCRTPKGEAAPAVPCETDNPEFYFSEKLTELIDRLDADGLAYVGPTYLRHAEHYTHERVDELLKECEARSREIGEEEGFQYLRPSVAKAAADRPVSLAGWFDRPPPGPVVDPAQYFETRWKVLVEKLAGWGFAAPPKPALYNQQSLTCSQVDAAIAAYEESFLQARQQRKAS